MSDLQSFGESFRGFMDAIAASAPKQVSELAERIRGAFGADPTGFPILSYEAEGYEHPNLQRALDRFSAAAVADGRAVQLIGVTSPNARYSVPTISEMLADPSVTVASPNFEEFVLPGGATTACLQLGVILVGGAAPALSYVEGPSERRRAEMVRVEVMAPTREAAEVIVHDLRRGVHELSVYRGCSLIVTASLYRGTSVRFHPLPKIRREDLILNQATLERIERQTIAFASHARELAAAGRHLKRGVLLYGPPGTGKTLSAMYLASRMEGRTVLLTAGLALGSLAAVCAFARQLQPSTVILEDVDLIAEDRGHNDGCSMPLLFEMLNQMDGLNEDADVLFLLTTNRPEALEPALAARPGRIDQAIEVPLPDAECRRRLFELCARGLDLHAVPLVPWIERTKGASAAFIRELIRRATLLALLDHGDAVIRDRDLDESMRELTVARSLTGRFLGFDGHAGTAHA